MSRSYWASKGERGGNGPSGMMSAFLRLWALWISELKESMDQMPAYADLMVLLVVAVRYEVSGVCSKTAQNGAAAVKLMHARKTKTP